MFSVYSKLGVLLTLKSQMFPCRNEVKNYHKQIFSPFLDIDLRPQQCKAIIISIYLAHKLAYCETVVVS